MIPLFPRVVITRQLLAYVNERLVYSSYHQSAHNLLSDLPIVSIELY